MITQSEIDIFIAASGINNQLQLGNTIYFSHPLTYGGRLVSQAPGFNKNVRNAQIKVNTLIRTKRDIISGFDLNIINPCKDMYIPSWNWEDWMTLWESVIKRCQLVILDDNWSSSRGCSLEKQIAIANQIPICTYTEYLKKLIYEN